VVLSGYLHPGYARSLSEFGTPTALPRSGAWFLERSIPGEPDTDATCCYPYLACQDWTALAADVDALGERLVSFTATPDPFGAYSLDDLQRAFPDVTAHFKDHYVADLTQPRERIASAHHRRLAEKALRTIDVECSDAPLALLDEFMSLFEASIRHFSIRGIRAYSRSAIAQQLALPGAYVTLARHGGVPVAAHMQLVHGETAYGHLAGATENANALGASYALYYTEIDYFANKARWLDWGAEATLTGAEGTLGRFKRGWSTGTRPAYFCGRVLNAARYDEIVRARGIGPTNYLPAYREGEFR